MLGLYKLLAVAAFLSTCTVAINDGISYCIYPGERRNRIWKIKVPKHKTPVVTKTDIQWALEKARRAVLETHLLEHELHSKHAGLSHGCPAFRNSAFRKAKPSALQKGDEAEECLRAAALIAKKKHLCKKDTEFGLADIPLADSVYAESCFAKPTCHPHSKYRTFDGSCNNLAHPKWGQAETAFRRLVSSDYGDGLNTPRLDKHDNALPSARTVSLSATVTRTRNKRAFTHMLMQWGQFLDHDLTLTPVYTAPENFTIACCKPDSPTPYQVQNHPACLPIPISPHDPFYKKHNVTCMEFVRSLPAVRRDCTLGPREQMNQITAYIDASNVYGSNEEEAKELRSFKLGGLKYGGWGNGVTMLPPDPGNAACIGETNPCFRAGDERVNEQPNLVIMHTIWMREHNRVAKELSKINKDWDDDKLYQEARRIVGAMMQHITYNEFLPIVLGPAFMKKNGLFPLRKGYADTYKKSVDASIANAFATAAYRFGHTLIQPKFEGYSSKYEKISSVFLHDVAFRPTVLYESDAMDPLIRGLTIQSSQRVDNWFPHDIKNMLFAKDADHGMDLVSLNIQRGRDHGLPGYIKYREACGLGKVTCFHDLKKIIGRKNIRRLKKTYKSVEDIDLFVGGLMERPKHGALIGDTFKCIIGDQFERLKEGDRFFYEYGGNKKTRFTKRQLREIRKASLSRVICDNSEGITRIQPRVFVRAGRYWNKIYQCSNKYRIKEMDLWAWKHY